MTTSYGELIRRADGWSDLLTAATDGRAPAVILLSDQVDAIAASLGCLSAAIAFVPVDHRYPPERTAAIVAAARSGIVIDDEGPTPQPGSTGPRAAAAQVDPGDVAYLVFTSGSTGRPKGVLVTHENLAYSTQMRSEVYRDEVERFLLLSPLGFDSSLAGIFWTLTQGGTLVVPDAIEPGILGRLASLRISHTLCTPSLHATFLGTCDAPEDAPATVILAGEAVRPELVELHLERLPSARLHIEYGPTEATVWASHCEARADAPGTMIGTALPGTKVRVVDDGGVECDEGELLIDGPGVALGYLDDGALTADRFRPEPGGRRSYATGDVVRRHPDGTLEFRGRIDDQLKIRGYRIEPSEVEARLASHPSVARAAVVGVPSADGVDLVAFVVPAAGPDPTPASLRAHVAVALPEAWVPSRFELIDALPTTPTGKLDRRTLATSQRRATPSAVSSLDEFQASVASIWSEVLGVDTIELDGDFFLLGGHSLLVARVVARVRDRLGIDPTVRLLFDNPTLGGFAKALEEIRGT